MRRIALCIFVLASSAGIAQAESTSARLNVSVQVVDTCSVTSQTAVEPTVTCGRFTAPQVTVTSVQGAQITSVQF